VAGRVHLDQQIVVRASPVTVPHPRKDMPKGTANAIFKAAGIK
jgi:predicted RNA binding protein YcfA (HicA-like mRNA interferase family)